MRELKRWIIRKALIELAREAGEFTQQDLHRILSELMGRQLTVAEKEKATKYAKRYAMLKEVRRDPDTKVRIYIFIL